VNGSPPSFSEVGSAPKDHLRLERRDQNMAAKKKAKKKKR
jgi:hypothetical protein